MKKIFTIIVLLVSINISRAQGNLQFNQVKNIDLNGSVSVGTGGFSQPISNIGTITVPNGKVWKIESGTGVVTGNQEGAIVFTTDIIFKIGNYTINNTKLPLWLSSGNYIITAIGPSNYNVVISISALEFNVIP
jgi:hypothetical protein